MGMSWTFDGGTSGAPSEYQRWRYKGDVKVNAICSREGERDRLTDTLAGLFAFGGMRSDTSGFMAKIRESQMVTVMVSVGGIAPIPEGMEQAPWTDPKVEWLFDGGYSVPVYGEFVSDIRTQELVVVEKVSAAPYLDESGYPPDDGNGRYA